MKYTELLDAGADIRLVALAFCETELRDLKYESYGGSIKDGIMYDTYENNDIYGMTIVKYDVFQDIDFKEFFNKNLKRTNSHYGEYISYKQYYMFNTIYDIQLIEV